MLTQKLYLLGLRAGSRSLLKISFFSFCRSCPHLLQAAIFFVISVVIQLWVVSL